MSTPTTTPLHPRERTQGQWKASLGAMASRGETTGPRVDAAREALDWHRHRTFLINDLGLTPDAAESLLEELREPEADA